MPAGQDQTVSEAIKRYWLHRPVDTIPFGLGTAALRRKDDLAVLLEAYANGYRYFDTSRHYGESEIVLGTFLAEVPRDDVFVATKTAALDEVAGRSAAEVRCFVRDCCERSLARLGVDRVDLYQLHEITSLGPDNRRAALQELEQRRLDGQCRYIGATGRSVEILTEVASSGLCETVLTYSDYTVLRQDAGNLLHVGAESDVAMINASPLAGGLLAPQHPRRTPSGSDAAEVRRAASFYDLCATHGLPPLALALQFSCRNPDVSITLTGPGTVDELLSGLLGLDTPVDAAEWQLWHDWYEGETSRRETAW